jgi:uncharacterized membrane protein
VSSLRFISTRNRHPKPYPEELARYLREKLGQVSVDIRDPLFTASSEEAVESLAQRLAEARVRDPLNPGARFQPLPGEVEFERKLIRNPSLRLSGVLYDGFMLQALASNSFPRGA